jgi:hypothetical protein
MDFGSPDNSKKGVGCRAKIPLASPELCKERAIAIFKPRSCSELEVSNGSENLGEGLRCKPESVQFSCNLRFKPPVTQTWR